MAYLLVAERWRRAARADDLPARVPPTVAGPRERVERRRVPFILGRVRPSRASWTATPYLACAILFAGILTDKGMGTIIPGFVPETWGRIPWSMTESADAVAPVLNRV
jgi:hypothetical protein